MQLNKDKLLEITKSNVSIFLSSFLRKLDSSTFFNHNGIECSYSGFKACYLNSVIGGNPFSNDFDADALKILSFFAKNGADCSWWMNRPADIKTTMAKMQCFGFNSIVRLDGMFLNMDSFRPAAKKANDFEVICVDSSNVFSDYALVYASFAHDKLKEEVQAYYLAAARQGLFISDNVKYFVGYHLNRPVCIGCICFDVRHKVIGVYDVLTVVDARNKGFATTLVSNMLNEAQKIDSNLCVLQSSEEAVNIYSSLGFKSFEDFFVMNNAGFLSTIPTGLWQKTGV
jgi:hypothetical protein